VQKDNGKRRGVPAFAKSAAQQDIAVKRTSEILNLRSDILVQSEMDDELMILASSCD
jgi:hypothetical protein